MATRFLVYVSPEGTAALCEGGVYSDAPQGEYSRNTIVRATECAAELNKVCAMDERRGTTRGRYETRASMEGVAVDSTVRSSLEAWQLALIGQPAPMAEMKKWQPTLAEMKKSGRQAWQDGATAALQQPMAPTESALAAAIHRTAMVQSIGRRPAKEVAAAERALRLAATDIAATCGYDHESFLRRCGF